MNGHEIWIAPVWNPDGYNHVFAPGYLPSVSRLTVTPTSATVVDVQLTPITTEPNPPQNLRIDGARQ